MKHINTILVANRGEIASRIFRTCKQMGIISVAVYADADKNAPYVQEADLAIHIGDSEPAASYLNQDKIIAAAKQVNADAIHPGYGFLSENPDFAERCHTENLIFIGPNVEAIRAMGSKAEAKSIMEKAKVPTIPGYKGKDQSPQTLKDEALRIGFPLLLKATYGGGGKGMRIVHKEDELDNAITSSKREAMNAFGNDDLMVEKYIASGRHIEFQVFGDQHRNVIHILERECTIQRRYQKVVEESPSPVLTQELRDRMGKVAVAAVKALNYDNAGTVEFIFDESTNDFFFLEVNTRLQVEHPVTEEITDLDLVKMQIESAKGMPLQVKQEDIKGNGYAIEVRLYAEDAENNFAPVTGTVHKLSYPEVEGLRVESAIQTGSEISMHYDPMIAKIIVHDSNRIAALNKLNYVLKNTICQGTKTNLAFLQTIINNDDFIAGNYDTHFIENKLDLTAIATLNQQDKEELAIVSTLYNWQQRQHQRTKLRAIPSGWRNNFYEHQKESIVVNDEDITVQYRYLDDSFEVLINDEKRTSEIINCSEDSIRLSTNGLQKTFAICVKDKFTYIHTPSIGNVEVLRLDRFPVKEKAKEKGGYTSPMPSKIIKLLVATGDVVKENDPLIVISSMKMESTIMADEDGTIEEIFVEEGQNVQVDHLLLKINSK
ncbi:acetyl/propionyl/methylcrotonyl-CoA carboxylase subunit alpha [Gelidibacter pelagius]|uniref:ATP-grasp domain-containing protein n=1 Tax=Gelidibacter pelagius TaxID=2819985 RepID=A0ABS3SQN4_9FLAO|nr:biotin carboxylase N-terminal domain-containing protein [Gelidibacter pelagius]MBO3098009.1 ATP-grasp domain-containing protein [Gelidibacter pelagius]